MVLAALGGDWLWAHGTPEEQRESFIQATPSDTGLASKRSETAKLTTELEETEYQLWCWQEADEWRNLTPQFRYLYPYLLTTRKKISFPICIAIFSICSYANTNNKLQLHEELPRA